MREEKEERQRLERELEGWKGLRVERGVLGSGAVTPAGLGVDGAGGRASSFANGSLRVGSGAGSRASGSNPSVRFASGTGGMRKDSGSGSGSGRGSSLAWSAKSEGVKRQLSNSKVYL